MIQLRHVVPDGCGKVFVKLEWENPTGSMKDFRTESIPKMRRFALDAGHLGRKRHIVHGLIEVDVTEVRNHIKEHKSKTGEILSFTAFLIQCLSEAIQQNPHLHAYRNWRNKLVIFDDINTMVEIDRDGNKIPIPHVFKSVNQKTYLDLHNEIREFLDLTISIDHDVVDGAPMVRFVNRFRDLIESGYGLI